MLAFIEPAAACDRALELAQFLAPSIKSSLASASATPPTEPSNHSCSPSATTAGHSQLFRATHATTHQSFRPPRDPVYSCLVARKASTANC